MNKERATFATRLGVIAASTGSAVGLGNIWRFPYETGQNGGAAFLLVYLVCVLLLGIPLIISEFVIGRKAKANVWHAFQTLAPRSHWNIIGYLSLLTAFIILSFYTVIAGWTMEYIYQAVINGFSGLSSEQLTQAFSDFSTDPWQPILWLAIFMSINYVILAVGVKKGIEKASNLMMSCLFIILIIFCIRSLFLPGAGEGLRFLFRPDFSHLTPTVILKAMGQAFFSLSVGMGCLMTYGSYFNKQINLGKTAFTVSMLDSLVALLAGIMIFPAVFSFGINPTAGAELVFITVPNVFRQMAGGYIWSVLFFVLIGMAALTSTISLFEVIIAFVHEKYPRLGRKKVTAWVIGTCFATATLCSLSLGPLKEYTIAGMNLFDLLDFTSANIFLPVGALLIALFTGYRLNRKTLYHELSNNGTLPIPYFKALLFCIRYIVPAGIVLIFLSGLGLFR